MDGSVARSTHPAVTPRPPTGFDVGPYPVVGPPQAVGRRFDRRGTRTDSGAGRAARRYGPSRALEREGDS